MPLFTSGGLGLDLKNLVLFASLECVNRKKKLKSFYSVTTEKVNVHMLECICADVSGLDHIFTVDKLYARD